MGDLSRPLTWTLRALGWLIAIGVIAVFAHKFGASRLTAAAAMCVDKSHTERSALAYGQKLFDCIYARSGPVERWMLRDAKEIVRALPYAPCRYVGVWRATRPGAVYNVTLQDDSTFTAEPIAPSNADTLTGSWGYHKDRLIWFYDNGRVWPPDINPVRNQNDDIFMVTEPDRSTTTYMLLKRFNSTACARL